MGKTLVAMVTPVSYKNAEMPLTSVFEGERADHYMNSTFYELLKGITKDRVQRSPEQKRMERECTGMLLESEQEGSLSIEVICYDADARQMQKQDGSGESVFGGIGLNDRIRPYIYNTDVDGTEYDAIDFLVSPVAIGGNYDGLRR